MEQIQYTGLDELNTAEKEILNTLSAEYYDKIQRELKNITSLQIHIKAHDKEGARTRWELHSKAVAPTQIFESSAEDWDFARTLHKIFKDLERQITHQLKSDNQHDLEKTTPQ